MTALPRIMLALALATLTLTPACDDVKVSDRDLAAVGEQRVVAALDEPETAIVDVRHPDRYAQGHIPGAINIFLPDIRPGDPRLASAQTIIVYAGGWNDPLSSAAAKRMIATGYTNVLDFRGGMELWQDAGYEIAGSETAPESEPDPAAGSAE